jgi:hypothetical protein
MRGRRQRFPICLRPRRYEQIESRCAVCGSEVVGDEAGYVIGGCENGSNRFVSACELEDIRSADRETSSATAKVATARANISSVAAKVPTASAEISSATAMMVAADLGMPATVEI